MKIICPNCHAFNDVSKNDKYCTCKECNREFDVTLGLQAFNKKYNDDLKTGHTMIYSNTFYDEGFEKFKEILEYKPNDVNAICGLISCNIFKSTLKNFNYIDFITILDSYDIYLNNENTYNLLTFEKSLIKYINYFYKQVDTRFKENDIFLNKEYFDYFVKDTNDLFKVVDYMKETFSIMDQDEYQDFCEIESGFKESFETVMKNLEGLKSAQFKVSGSGIYILNGEKIAEFAEKTSISEVDNLDIFVEDTSYIKKKRLFTILIAALVVISIVMLVVGLIIKNTILSWLACVPLAVAGLIFYLSTKKKS